MDRFKFRVWNGDMYTQEFFLPNIAKELQSDTCGGLMDKNAVSCLWDDMLTTDAVIEQCTGLKDKNGKLIYEGDEVIYTRTYVDDDEPTNIWRGYVTMGYNDMYTDCGHNSAPAIGWYLKGTDFPLLPPEEEQDYNGDVYAVKELTIIGNIHKEADLKKCQDCGKEKEDVRERSCPYEEEINNNIVIVTICDDCERERLYEI